MKKLVTAVAGSHLFGTNTPTSDKDFKGVYLPTHREIILGKVQKTISIKTNTSNQRNTQEDVDQEYYSLDKFLRMLQEGQTVALELLFTPEELILETSDEWKQIQALRDQLVHKNVAACIGYARTQANRYGIRGSRMAAVAKSIKVLGKYKSHETIQDAYQELMALEEEYIETAIVCLRPYLMVCGKKYELEAKIGYVLERLKRAYDEYGARSKQALLNEGIDWKALSHAVRVIRQGIEILQTGKLSFPSKSCDLLRRIKGGEYDFEMISDIIEYGFKELQEAEKISTLRETLTDKYIEDLIYEFYSKQS